jgi:hypothetical protein
MIPKRFQLVNRTYTVKSMPAEIAEKKHGDVDREMGLVRLAKDKAQQSTEHTFYHELAHALLWASTKPKLSDNEKFVDSLGALLHQYEQTKKGEYDEG